MVERVNLPTDAVTILALAFGAAVMVPSLIALLFTLLAIVDVLF